VKREREEGKEESERVEREKRGGEGKSEEEGVE